MSWADRSQIFLSEKPRPNSGKKIVAKLRLATDKCNPDSFITSEFLRQNATMFQNIAQFQEIR